MARYQTTYTEALTTELENQINTFMEVLETTLGELDRSTLRFVRERAELLVRAAVSIDRKETK